MNRISWIDTLKGIGIILVIIAHIDAGPVSSAIYIFHMPLFFFISGYLFKKDENISSFFSKKAIHLLIPYFFFLTIIYIPQVLLADNGTRSTFGHIYSYFYGGTHLTGWTGIFWFTACLLITQQIFNFMMVYSEKWITYISLAFITLAYLNQFLFKTLSLPLAAHIVLYALPIYYLGYLFKTQLREMTQFSTAKFMVLALVSIVIFYFHKELSIEMKYTNYGIPIVSFLGGLILIFFSIMLSMLLTANTNYFDSFLRYCGEASMVIMYLHQPIQMSIDSFVTHNPYVRFACSLVIPLCVYYIANKNAYSRILMTGSYSDYKKLKFKFVKN